MPNSLVVYCEMCLVGTSKRAGGTTALEDTIQGLRKRDSEVLYFSRGCHNKISAVNCFHLYSGNRSSVTLYFTNITVQDDDKKGYYQCTGYSASGGKPVSQRFTVGVTASKLEILGE